MNRNLLIREESGAAAARPTSQQFLVFTLGSEAFAIDIKRVREIIEMGQMTRVPMMPPSVLGVANVRGAMVPVVDLQIRFGRGVTPLGRRTCVVILEMPAGLGQQVVGVMVDAVNEVVEIPLEQIESPPAFGAGIHSDFIAGMARRGERFVILLDALRVFSGDELALLERERHGAQMLQ